MYVAMYVCMYVCISMHMCMGAYRGQKRALSVLDLDLQVGGYEPLDMAAGN